MKKIVYKKLKTLTKKKFNDKTKVTELGIDSLDLLQLVTDVEDQLKIAVPDKEIELMITIGDVITIFEKNQK